MNRFFLLLFVFLTACDSAESPTLRECRLLQENILTRTAQSDSLLNEQLTQLRDAVNTMSSDTLLATDSLLRNQYSSLKESANNLEFKRAELHAWRDHLIMLPPTGEIAVGITNPFGESAGDKGILEVLTRYNDTLTILETSISELIRITPYERTSTPQPQE
jgi:hypothetical protein